MDCRPFTAIWNTTRGRSPRSARRFVAARLRRQRRMAAAALLWLVGASGCASLSQNPVADNVVNSRQLSMRGLDAMHHGKWDEAEAMFASAIKSCPVDERAHQHYAETLWQRGAHADAIEHMQTAVKLSGNDPLLLVRIGQMHLANGQLPVASHYADAAIGGNRHLAEAWALKGDVERGAGRWDESLANYHRALSLNESLAGVPQAVAEIYLARGEAQRSLSTVQAAAEKFPAEQIPGELLRIEGLALKSLGRYADADSVLTVAWQRGEASDAMLYELGHARLLSGNPASARLALNEALRLNPTHLESRRLREQIDQAANQMATMQR